MQMPSNMIRTIQIGLWLHYSGWLSKCNGSRWYRLQFTSNSCYSLINSDIVMLNTLYNTYLNHDTHAYAYDLP